MKINDILNTNDNYILIIGMRCSGKSIIVRDILTNCYNLYPAKVVISNTEKLNRFHEDFIDKKFIYDKYESSILNKVFERQKLLIDNNKNHKTVIILDDCLTSRGTWVKNEEIINLFNNKSNHKLTTIFCFQFSLGIPPNMREQFDYVFLVSEDFQPNRKRLYEHYGHYIFDTFEEFDKIYVDITRKENFNCMVLNIRKKEYYEYKVDILENKIIFTSSVDDISSSTSVEN